MGVDYFLINKTKKEYVWTGRRNIVFTSNNLYKNINEKMLEYGFSKDFYEEVFYQEYQDDPSLISFYIENLSWIYNIVKDYIKGNECICVPDYEWPEEFNNFKNNLIIEDAIMDYMAERFNVCGVME